MPLNKVHRVTVLGMVIGILSFSLPFITFKENRLAKGVPLFSWEVLVGIELFIIIVPWIILSLLTLYWSSWNMYSVLCGIFGNLIIIAVFFLIGRSSTRLLQSEESFARIAMGFGSWGMIAAGYVLINSSIQKKSLKRMWRFTLALSGVIVLIFFMSSGVLGDLSILKEYAVRKDRFLREFYRHLLLSGVSVSFAIVIGVPLGVWAFRRKIFERPIFFIVNTIQTIPSLALFGIMIAPLSILSYRYPFLRELGIKGVGMTPAVIALTLYALLPITRNTYTSLKVLDPSVLDAAKGMGMGKLQLLLNIQIPLSFPILMNGIRISMVQAIGNTTVAALIGAGGFGVFVFQGLGQAVPDLILLGAIPVIILAICFDKILHLVINSVTPKGLRLQREISG